MIAALFAYAIAATMRPGKRYTGWRWRYVAAYVRERDGFTCQHCHDRGFVVHHKRAVADGGSHFPHNLVTLCLACHADIHEWLEVTP